MYNHNQVTIKNKTWKQLIKTTITQAQVNLSKLKFGLGSHPARKRIGVYTVTRARTGHHFQWPLKVISGKISYSVVYPT